MKEMYIITGKIKGSDDIKYLSFDNTCGCSCYYWSGCLTDSVLFNSYEDCKKVIESSDFSRECITTNGIKYPPRLLQNLSKTNFNKMSEDIEIFISKLHLENLSCQEYHCEIKNPIKVNYEYK